MGDQGVQQIQQQQPVVVYPNAYTKQYPYPSSSSSASSSSSSSGSRGSFGTVFIVLAVILVLSVLACVFGRLCNRGDKQQHSKQPKNEKGSSKKSREIRPVDREPRERGDLEFGLDMKRPETIEKPSGRDHGEDIESGFDNKREESGGGGPPPPVIKHGVRFKLPEENGDQHAGGEIRRGGPDIELRPRH